MYLQKVISHKKKLQNSRNQIFFGLMIEGSGPLTNGSGCGSERPKNIWILRIRMRFRNTASYECGAYLETSIADVGNFYTIPDDGQICCSFLYLSPQNKATDGTYLKKCFFSG
jgi:hypothetical protein